MMLLDPEHAISEPKYYAVKRHLPDFIGSLEPGAALPTERELAARMLTSRTTVRQALGELVVEGRLVRRQLPAARFPGITRLIRTYGPLHAILSDQYETRIRTSEESIETVPATPREAGPPKVDVGTPMLIVAARTSTQTEPRSNLDARGFGETA